MTNWSVILNVLLLAGVVLAIARLMVVKRQVVRSRRVQPMPSAELLDMADDTIIAVRKIEPESTSAPELVLESGVEPMMGVDVSESASEGATAPAMEASNAPEGEPVSLLLFLLAKDQRQLAGYELLQTILAAGLRFGDGQLFHRHQFDNGQGPIICSLATATETGIFDLQNMGAFSVHGLCLFMEASGNPSIDEERLSIMLDTAKQLTEGLDTLLLDDARERWSEKSLARYRHMLQLTAEEEKEEVVI